MKCYIFSSVSLVSFDVLFLPVVDLKLTQCIMKENKKTETSPERLLVRFPVRTHAWVGGGTKQEGQRIDVSLSNQCFPLPSFSKSQ